MTARDAYSVLGLDPTSATPAEIRSAWGRLMLRHHPDHVHRPELGVAANEQTMALIEAYQTLRNQGFPRLYPTKSTENWTAWTHGIERMETQPDNGDPEFDRDFAAWVRDFGTAWNHDVERMGAVRTTAAWTVHGYKVFSCLLIAAFGIVLAANGAWVFGLPLAILGALLAFGYLEKAKKSR